MKNFLLTALLNLFVRFFHFTYRYQIIGEDNLEKAKKSNPYRTFVLSVWHQMMFSTLTGSIGKKYALIVSRSKDGDFIANACKSFGHVPTRGSSSKGGKEALIEVIKLMKSGLPAAMAVDGPRGPYHVVKPGTVEMARLTQSPIVTWASYASSFWCFHKAWDKFILPKPFAKIVIIYGEPIFVKENLSRVEFDQMLIYVADRMIADEEKAKSLLAN